MSALWLELRLAVAFLTRLPLPHPAEVTAADVTRAARWFPLVGAAMGAAAAGLYSALLLAGVPPMAAGWIAVGAHLLLSGALHEDGLADTADGFGGGRDVAGKLAILRDSRLGTYGAAALLVALGLKAALIAALPAGLATVVALAVAEGASRAVVPWLMYLMPPARKDGLGAAMAPVGAEILLPATALAAGLILLAGPVWLLIVPGLVVLGMRRLAMAQIGGFTGDVLGAAQQVALLALLTILVAMGETGGW